MDSPQDIIKKTHDGILNFFRLVLGERKLQAVLDRFHEAFPTWEHFWNVIRVWLQQQPMIRNTAETVHAFAKLFPSYPDFSRELDQSLVAHEVFWNQVHANLCTAKGRLQSCST